MTHLHYQANQERIQDLIDAAGARRLASQPSTPGRPTRRLRRAANIRLFESAPARRLAA